LFSKQNRIENISKPTLPIPQDKAAVIQSFMASSVEPSHTSCMYCGVLYASHYDLHQHLKRGCPEADSDIDEPPCKKVKVEEEQTESEAEEELDSADNCPAFESFINDAYDIYHEDYANAVEQLMKDGKSKKKAEYEAGNLLHSKYRKHVMEEYKKFMFTLYHLNSSPLHNKVKEAVNDYFNAGKGIKRATNLAVEEYKEEFKELFDEENDTDVESSETTEDETSTDENENID